MNSSLRFATILIMISETQAAKAWDHPKGIIHIEEGRYTTERALAKIIGDSFRRHTAVGSLIFETGAGSGYLKSLVPPEYTKAQYFSSDYSRNNLKEGLKKRQLNAPAASAYDLPLRDNSVDCLVNMDAYDTLPNLDRALIEAKRVLRPNGVFIHFQVNSPSDDTVQSDYPNYIFFPGRIDEKTATKGMMMGATREDLERGLKYISTPPFRKVIQDFLDRPWDAFVKAQQHPETWAITDMIFRILYAMPGDKLVIPSLPDYFRNKLWRSSLKAGLEIVESEFRATSLRLERSKSQLKFPKYNQFSLEQGARLSSKNPELEVSGSNQVIEQASMLVFVAKKQS